MSDYSDRLDDLAAGKAREWSLIRQRESDLESDREEVLGWLSREVGTVARDFAKKARDYDLPGYPIEERLEIKGLLNKRGEIRGSKYGWEFRISDERRGEYGTLLAVVFVDLGGYVWHASNLFARPPLFNKNLYRLWRERDNQTWDTPHKLSNANIHYVDRLVAGLAFCSESYIPDNIEGARIFMNRLLDEMAAHLAGAPHG